MKSDLNSVTFQVSRIMQSNLSRRGLNIRDRKLMETILVLLAKNENEVLCRIKEKKNYETKLKKWLDSPIETECTNALEEHDMVV